MDVVGLHYFKAILIIFIVDREGKKFLVFMFEHHVEKHLTG